MRTHRLFMTAWLPLSLGCMGTIDGDVDQSNSEPGPGALSPGTTGAGMTGPGSLSPGTNGAGMTGPGAPSPGTTGAGMTGPGSPAALRRCGADTTPSVPPLQRLYLLDMQSYTNAVSDLLGAAAVSDAARVQARRTDLFVNGVPTLTLGDAFARETVADSAARTLTGSRLDTFAGCTGAAQTDDCARKALTAFMTGAYRRPADTTVVDALMAGPYRAGRVTSFERGVQVAVRAVLQSGSAMYLREIGVSNGKGIAVLDPYEVASQISFTLLDSIPDTALLQAAASGKLKMAADVEAQVGRLLGLPRAQAKLTELLLRQYHLDDILAVSAIDVKFQKLLPPSTLVAMNEESSRLIQDVLWTRPRSFLELIQTNKTFVNAELAALYGVPFTGKTGEWAPAMLPAERGAGLLTQGSLTAGKAKANSGSVVKRGKALRINFLCLGSPPPPPTEIPSVKAKLEMQAASNASESNLASERARDPSCKGCHATFDPLGLALNQFDRAGRFVGTEMASASMDGVDPRWAGMTVNGPVDLATKMAAHPALASCVASSVLRYATHEPNDVSDCAVRTASERFIASGFSFESLVKAATTSDLFLTRSEGGRL